MTRDVRVLFFIEEREVLLMLMVKRWGSKLCEREVRGVFEMDRCWSSLASRVVKELMLVLLMQSSVSREEATLRRVRLVLLVI